VSDDPPVVRVPLVPRWLRLAAVVAAAAVVAYFSLLTEASPPSAGPLFDKYVHFAGYTVLAWLAAYATVSLRDRPAWRATLVVVGVAGYGLAVELLQAPLPGRQFSLYDQAANTLGALTVVVWLLVERRVGYRRVEP